MELFTNVAGFCWSIFKGLGILGNMSIVDCLNGGWFISAGNPFTSFVFAMHSSSPSLFAKFIADLLSNIPFLVDLSVFGLVLALVPFFFLTSLAVNALRTILGE